MRIKVAPSIGFCFGVKRAINLAKRARHKFQRVYSLGALIHNPEVVAELRDSGIKEVQSIDDARGGALVIRSHGTTPETLALARRRGLQVIDATCPYVGRVQRVARDLQSAGYSVIIVGERDHPEVQSILGYARGEGMVFSAGMKIDARKIGVVAQTTIPWKTFQTALADLCQRHFEELRVFNTICAEAAGRQDAAHKLAREVDLMVVIGGHNSANTSRLADIARNAGKQTYQVENEQELNPDWFQAAQAGKPSPVVVGVTAGTSTPSWVVDDVLAKLRTLSIVGTSCPARRGASTRHLTHRASRTTRARVSSGFRKRKHRTGPSRRTPGKAAIKSMTGGASQDA